MISMIPGQTIQCVASAVTSLCAQVFAEVVPTTPSKSPPIKQRVGFSALTGTPTVDTVVTCPSGYYYQNISINIANSNASNRTVIVYLVDSGDAVGTDNFLAYESVVPAKGTLTINEVGASA